MELKFCSHCGNELEEDTGFLCISCSDILEKLCEQDKLKISNKSLHANRSSGSSKSQDGSETESGDVSPPRPVKHK